MTEQPFFCNGCGTKVMRKAGAMMGRDYRCCSIECVRETQRRDARSIVGEPAVRETIPTIGSRVLLEATVVALNLPFWPDDDLEGPPVPTPCVKVRDGIPSFGMSCGELRRAAAKSGGSDGT
jgi:hypothetical protein